jgi:endonuclease/exonuclease/phosphatase family metal-dependent hydrolase
MYAGGTKRVVSWNMKVGRNHQTVLDGLADLIKATNPSVVCLQEAKGYVGDLRKRFGNQWHIYAQNDWEEAADNPVMTLAAQYKGKKRGDPNGWDTLRTTTHWVGPQGGGHKGRTWTWAKCDGLWVMSFHRVTAGKDKNQAAFRETYDNVGKWIGGHSPCLILGDHNCGPGATFAWASKPLAQTAGGTISAPSSGGIDYAIQHNVKGTVVTKGNYGSDHPAILWTLKA